MFKPKTVLIEITEVTSDTFVGKVVDQKLDTLQVQMRINRDAVPVDLHERVVVGTVLSMRSGGPKWLDGFKIAFQPNVTTWEIVESPVDAARKKAWAYVLRIVELYKRNGKSSVIGITYTPARYNNRHGFFFRYHPSYFNRFKPDDAPDDWIELTPDSPLEDFVPLLQSIEKGLLEDMEQYQAREEAAAEARRREVRDKAQSIIDSLPEL